MTVGLTRVEDRTGEVGLKNKGCSLGTNTFHYLQDYTSTQLYFYLLFQLTQSQNEKLTSARIGLTWTDLPDLHC